MTIIDKAKVADQATLINALEGGLEEGFTERDYEIAIRLLTLGISPEDIATVIELNVTEVLKLKKEREEFISILADVNEDTMTWWGGQGNSNDIFHAVESTAYNYGYELGYTEYLRESGPEFQQRYQEALHEYVDYSLQLGCTVYQIHKATGLKNEEIEKMKSA